VASPDETPLEGRAKNRVKAAEHHGTLAGRWYVTDVSEFLAVVVRLQQERDEQEKLIAELRSSWDSWHKQLQEKKRVVVRLQQVVEQAQYSPDRAIAKLAKEALDG